MRLTHQKSNFTYKFLTFNVHFARKGCGGYLKIAILPQFFDVQRPFRAKGLQRIPQNRNFTSIFDVQRLFRAKRLQRIPQNRNFTSIFDVQRLFRAKGLRLIPQKSQFYLLFLMFNVHFAPKGCGGYLNIAILPQFFDVQRPFRAKGLRRIPQKRYFTSVLTSDVHEMLCLSRCVALRRHRPRLKREIERRARERKEERERRSADVKVRGSRSADVKV